jgi:hypothetical protein
MHRQQRNTKIIVRKVILLCLVIAMVANVNGYAQKDTTSLGDTVVSTKDSAEQTVGYGTASQDEPVVNTAAPDTVTMRNVPDSAVKAAKQKKDFAYANDAAYWAKEPPPDDDKAWNSFWGFTSSKAARVFIYLVIASVLIFAFYRIVVENNLYLFYKKPKRLPVAAADVVDIYEEDIEGKINYFLSKKDYRNAIRYMHLKALRILDEKGFIHFHAQSTNYEYATQLASTKLESGFRVLNNVYDYVWYGGFILTENQADMVRENFNEFYSTVNP